MGAKQAELTVQLEAPQRDGRGKRMEKNGKDSFPTSPSSRCSSLSNLTCMASISSNRPLHCVIMLTIVLYGIVMYYIVIASVLYHAPRHRPAPKNPPHVTK